MGGGAIRYEADLVREFLSALDAGKHPWGKNRHATEFNYRRARTDIVAQLTAGPMMAVEAKLAKWRDAIHQAYRNRCYAHESYVLLPENLAKNVSQFADEFHKAGVGLCTISDSQITILIAAQKQQPLQPKITGWAEAYILGTTLSS